jgi:hypothetical protein
MLRRGCGGLAHAALEAALEAVGAAVRNHIALGGLVELAFHVSHQRAGFGFTDEELAELARCSVRGSRAPAKVTARLLAGIDDWLAAPPEPA